VTTVDISTLQAVRDLLSLLETETEVILTEMNKPVAKVVPYEPPRLPNSERVPDLHPGVWISEDFDDFLPREFWADKL
jgi:antitoxin (DNA-binding transcriptional repressor) of toxin-antitoxin stability system